MHPTTIISTHTGTSFFVYIHESGGGVPVSGLKRGRRGRCLLFIQHLASGRQHERFEIRILNIIEHIFACYMYVYCNYCDSVYNKCWIRMCASVNVWVCIRQQLITIVWVALSVSLLSYYSLSSYQLEPLITLSMKKLVTVLLMLECQSTCKIGIWQ